MEEAFTVARARALFGELPRPLGFVPTMGALHDGHLELVGCARERCASVAASIFVNPLQFGPAEDLAAYPRDGAGDRAKLAAAGVAALFAPEPEAMYARDFAITVDPGTLGGVFEGALRPGHFRGVATVIAKLLHVVGPNVIFLGQKDAQQSVLVRKMIRDLDFDVELEVVPTVREPDGLAMSSRNAYLDPTLRAQAPSLHAALLAVREALARGITKSAAVTAGRAVLSTAATLDYLDVVSAGDFTPLDRLEPPAFIIGAARFGTTRLIDNLWIR